MITIDFSKRGNLSLTGFLYQSLKQQILDGTLKPGEHLPSKRSLAQHLGVSVITIENAYDNLIAEGYIYSIEKKGFFVEEFNAAGEIAEKQSAAIIPVSEENTEKTGNPAQTQSFFADFTKNAIAANKFPFNTWAKVTKQVLTRQSSQLLATQNMQGCPALRQAICQHLKSFRNIEADYDQIIIGAGSEILYNFILQLLGTNHIYAVENPGYHKIYKVFTSLGAKCAAINIDKSGILINQLEKSNARTVHVTPSHHFPTGIVMPIKRRLELLAWASAAPSRYIIEDDYDSEFRFMSRPIEPLFVTDRNSRVIYMNTFTKSLAPSFRISYMVLPKPLLALFKQNLNFYSSTVSAVEQFTLASFINQGFFSRHVIKMKNYYRSVRNFLIAELQNSKIKSQIEILEENSGLHFLLNIKSGKSASQLKEDLAQNGINAKLLQEYFYSSSDSSDFFSLPKAGAAPDAKNQAAFVINYSGIQIEDIKQIVQRIEKSL
ncbi:MAG: PLP-dependent aminotransferase family protein [Treponemataceae bacterium]|nr:PLP-dependent aminotransferase family protein [Treponemataceae bacterium]